jgi:hypothetical protein
MFVLFLLKVGTWKNPHGKELQKTIVNIAGNNIESLNDIFENALNIYLKYVKDKENSDDFDHKLIDTFGKIRGFGKKTGSRKMVSAILRFLDPTKYGTVDYRNWIVLSNTEHQFLDKALVEPLADTLEESRHVNIDTQKYLCYLKVIRKLAKNYNMTPAEVDMALFAYSDEIIPLGKEVIFPMPKSKEKALRMMEVIEEIANSVRNLGFDQHAKIFLSRVEPLARKGDYEQIYRYCERAISGRPHVDEMIEKRGGKSLRNQFHRIKEIYEST